MSINKNLIKKMDLAKELRVTPGVISNYICKGLPVRRDGRIDRVRALKWISENVTPQIASAGLKGAARVRNGNGHRGDLDPVRARMLRDAAIARKYELANDIAEGKVALIEDCATALAEHCASIRSRLLSLGSKLGPALVDKSAAAIKQAIDQEVRTALEELSSLDAGETASAERREQVVRARFGPSAQRSGTA